MSGESRAQGSFAGPTVSVQPRRTHGAGYLGTDSQTPPRVGRAAGVEAVLCDLDDTLYPQAAWLEGAWRAVAAAAGRHGIDEQAFLAALQADAALGSARGGIINRALAAVTAAEAPVVAMPLAPLVPPVAAGSLAAVSSRDGGVASAPWHGEPAGASPEARSSLLNPAPSQPANSAMHPGQPASSRDGARDGDGDGDRHESDCEQREPNPGFSSSSDRARDGHGKEHDRHRPETEPEANRREHKTEPEPKTKPEPEPEPEPEHKPEHQHKPADQRTPTPEPEADCRRPEPGADHHESGPGPDRDRHKPEPEPGTSDLDPDPDPALISHLVTVFRAHRPSRLEPYPGVREALTRLRMAGVRLAVITDGDVDMQAWKVRALGLSAFFECVVVSDALGGRAARKPHSASFLAALEGLGVGADRCVVVGDRPEKDVTGASGVDIRAIRVKTGEYHQVPDAPGTWHTASDFAGAVDWLLNG